MARLWPLAAAALLLAGGCVPESSSTAEAAPADAAAGKLGSRPGKISVAGTKGLVPLKGALLYVPDAYHAAKPMPLVVMLHGAGGTARHSLDLARAYADRHSFILLAPGSQRSSWDIISSRSYGPDVTAIDAVLKQVFEAYAVDAKRLAISGFSDGASYALSLGLGNGELFTDVIAFAPGFMAPGRIEGDPAIFISHGVDDQVLPIDRCSRRIVPQLRRSGYKVDYREFPGGHTVPPDLADAAFAGFVSA